MIAEKQIEEALKELFGKLRFTEEPAGLYEPLRYMIQIGGKRIRPRICLLSYSLFKDSLDESILAPAAAIEVFHSFTLIHDDIMDNAAVRRGMPTVWKKWDANTAILSGDSMCIESYRLLGKAPAERLPEVLKLFSDTAAQVCEGQQYDMEFESRESVPMDDYIMMIGLKTAVLIACAAKMGALIAGADTMSQELVYQYAYSLGLAFQVADDYLDTFGDPSVFGKAIGGDILNDKKSWLLTKAFELTDSDTLMHRALLEAMALPVGSDEEKERKISAVKEIYIRLGVGDAAKSEIRKYHEEALGFAAQLPVDGVGHAMLQRYAESLLGRAK